ncbi:hypothetical protein COLO4_26890 [Corchorus olitorius]|uniref:Uncharacterized protein n=1 Tax=Corchorus olitorius TaxID=93759 RepID=A0A1R3HTL1_9ROSI|nr:hypothetical protein COLO4_26890 [Corchorus olitorius]
MERHCWLALTAYHSNCCCRLRLGDWGLGTRES